MNGAESLIHTLLAGGVDVCFANPGTSEMHFVAALDRVDGMRCVPCLFEGVAAGAADGYGRMRDAPAATLLHLGPGLGNALANLHNARKAFTPVVNIVGDHATSHRRYEAPLTSDIEGQARPTSHWLRTSASSLNIARDTAEAIAAARTAPGQIATLILPGDVAWEEGEAPARPLPVPAAAKADEAALMRAVQALRADGPNLLLLGGRTLRQRGLGFANQIAAATGCSVMSENPNSRVQVGAGRTPFDRLPYGTVDAIAALRPFRRIILVETRTPVAFFANPGRPSLLAQPDAEIVTLADVTEDGTDALERLVEALGAGKHAPIRSALELPAAGSGSITLEALARSVIAFLPEDGVVVDETISSSHPFMALRRTGRPVDWLTLSGGSIGFGLPAAVGAAIACPGRRVVSLEADGSGMYTNQALWTMAREGLDITVVIFANRSYATLVGELANVGINAIGSKARDTLELERPAIDWVGLSRSLGVPAERAEDMEGFNRAFQGSLRSPGPSLIEVPLPAPPIPMM